MKRDMNGKLLSPIEAGEDIIVPIARIILKGWAASQRSVPPCLENGIMKRTKKHPKIVLRGPIKKCGGNVVPAATNGRHPLTIDFVGAVVLFAQKNGVASLLSTNDTSEQMTYRLLRLFCKSQSALILLLHLSKSQSLRWIATWFGFGPEKWFLESVRPFQDKLTDYTKGVVCQLFISNILNLLCYSDFIAVFLFVEGEL